MPDKTSFIEVKTKDDLRTIRIGFANYTPHWLSYCNDGGAYMEVTTHDKAKWVSFDTQEWSNSPKKHTKRTMITLHEDAARKLYEQLHEVYGKKE